MASGKQSKGNKKRTPVMEQYFRAKGQHPDAVLFFRLGDFYEVFYDDAAHVASLLDITLTSRGEDETGEKIPMAGVPWHSAASYIAKLLDHGLKVAVCEQMADPTQCKGVVPREVVRVITPGLCLEPDALDSRAHNYLTAVAEGDGGSVGLAALELSTGELRACEVPDTGAVLGELVRLEPREVLVPDTLADLDDALQRALPRAATRGAPHVDDARALIEEVLGADEASRAAADIPAVAVAAAAAALRYARDNHPNVDVGVRQLAAYDPDAHLGLDEAAVRNLELVRTLAGERNGSLFALLDDTRTAMGARLLKRRLLAPLTDVAAIRRRHDAVEALWLEPGVRNAMRRALDGVGDIERLATRVAVNQATPRDLGAIRDALAAAERVVAELAERSSGPGDDALGACIPADRLQELRAELERQLVEEPPVAANQGGIFAAGVDERLDEQQRLSSRSKDVILELEQRERERTGIGSLKVRYTRVFGYYIEVTKANLGNVPSDYRRKQTVAGGERFVTDELAELQDAITGADERAAAIENELFGELRARVAEHVPRLRELAVRLADLDVHAGLAEIAHRYGYVRPEVADTTTLAIEEGRHPVVEQLAAAGEFVPNDVELDAEGQRLMVITGPNMSGKSTAMRQVALSMIMAQMGSFVAAKRARIGIADKVFTRVGATDYLARGQSTFMVEMRETATILRGASRRSLVILDEIGRGTSTYDGLAIAWAVAEHLHDVTGCRALFATHYHELCELGDTRDGVVNFNVAAREYGNDVIFLHRLVPGGANRSYGIAVARLAGVPPVVLARARALLQDLEQGQPLPSGSPARMRGVDPAGRAQLDLFEGAQDTRTREPSEVERTLREVDIERMTPVDALMTLQRLKQMLEDGE